jgi:hypothetical protein
MLAKNLEFLDFFEVQGRFPPTSTSFESFEEKNDLPVVYSAKSSCVCNFRNITFFYRKIPASALVPPIMQMIVLNRSKQGASLCVRIWPSFRRQGRVCPGVFMHKTFGVLGHCRGEVHCLRLTQSFAKINGTERNSHF